MKVLIDTHTLIWSVDQNERLSAAANELLSDVDNELLLSAASLWEIAIKCSIGKITLAMAYNEWMKRAIADLTLTLLPITIEVADVQRSLPWHHRDPFDRMVVAHAIVEDACIVSKDPAFDLYDVTRSW